MSITRDSLGLSEEWSSIIKVLQRLVYVYEKANKIMSLFTLSYVRSQACVLALKRKPKRVLDAGSGPGIMTKCLLKSGCKAYYIEMDPIIEMLYVSKNKDNKNIDHVRGVFEFLPFRESAFDLVISGFAFRDALNMVRAVAEFRRVLIMGGKALILDLGKPSGKKVFCALMENIYMRFFPIIIGLLLLGKYGKEAYRGLYETYKRYPYTPHIFLLFKKIMGQARAYYLLSGATMIIEAFKE